MGKLDATMVANGPEDVLSGWDAVNWRAAEENVRRLRQRIFTASQAGDLKRVRNLQKLMLRSRSNTLVSVRRVTEINAGRKTAGVDGKVVLTPEDRADLAGWLQHQTQPWAARPVRRVYIPKASGKQRPLGIPVIADRAQQARVASALEPEWEARFEPRSYGFRPGRGCHDAIEAIFQAGKGRNGAGPRRMWVLDADLAAAFDRIDHDHLLSQLGTFPARELVAGWLTAGVVEDGRFTPTGEGTPQGGIITPPTQRAISASRSRWVTGVWSADGERRAAGAGGRAVPVSGISVVGGIFCLPLDIICSIFVSCLEIAARVPLSTRSMSTRLPTCWRPGLLRRRPRACWPGGWAARNGRRAATSGRPRSRAGSRSRR